MNLTTLLINSLAILAAITAFVKDKERGIRALKKGMSSFIRILPTVLIIVVIIGFLLGFFPEEAIRQFINGQSGATGLLVTAGTGSVLHIPSLIAFPLAASIMEMGAPVAFTAVFITTLTMVGIVTLPMEIRELGYRFALMRNLLSLLAAAIIAVIMGGIL